MSATLVIDTSTNRTIVALVADQKVLFQASHDDPLAHGEVLPRLVADALKVSNSVGEVVVGMGPGPFTGLRSGIAFAESFALARAIKVLGVCSLDAIATNKSDPEFLIVSPAFFIILLRGVSKALVPKALLSESQELPTSEDGFEGLLLLA